MNKTVKVTLIVGAVLICIGLITVIVAGIVGGWNFESVQWETKSFTTEIEDDLTDIELEFSAGELKVEFYNGDVIQVQYPHSQAFTTKCSVSGSTLHIETTKLHWYTSFTWIHKIPETKIYIPEHLQLRLNLTVNAGAVSIGAGTYKAIDVELNAGAVYMYNITCMGNFDVELNAGAMKISRVECLGKFTVDVSAGALDVANGVLGDDIKLNLSAGSVNINIDGEQADYTIITHVSAGSCNLASRSGGSKRLTVDVSAGSATVNFSKSR